MSRSFKGLYSCHAAILYTPSEHPAERALAEETPVFCVVEVGREDK